jgi:DNA primase
MARRKLEERNVRSLFKLAGGKSYALTLPIEVVRDWGWQNRQKLQLTIDEKKKRIIVEDWTKSSKK